MEKKYIFIFDYYKSGKSRTFRRTFNSLSEIAKSVVENNNDYIQCKYNNLTAEEVLILFTKVCAVIEHKKLMV